MRFSQLRLCLVLVFGLAGSNVSPAQVESVPTPHRVGEVSFLLPANWRVRPQATGPLPPGVVFSADDGSAIRFTVSKLPVSLPPTKPLRAAVDAMSAPETADQRIALEESGLTPLSGTYQSANEGGSIVETMGFRCKSPDAREYVVLTTTWRGRGDGWRARLQFSESAASASGGLLNGIRSSIRFRDAATIGFGSFRLAESPIPPTWEKALAALPGGEPAMPASVTFAPSQAPETKMTPVDVSAEQSRILQEHRGSLVFIDSNGGAGSGFVCQTAEGTFLLTNQHVLASMTAPRFTRLDRTPITVGAGSAAVGHDIMRFALQSEAKPLPVMADVEAEARIGDDVVVLGNGEGAGVIHPLPGKLIGIGPDKVEVSSEFVPGNSGSPIIHVKSGKVIGIATYLIQRRYSELTSGSQGRVRRFGYRIDSVKNWQPLNWALFQQDKATMDSIETTTRELLKLIEEIQTPKGPTPVSYTNSAISRAVRDTNAVLERKGISAADRKRTMLGFFSSVRSATQSDVAQARQKLRYDYFLRALSDETQGREELFKLFDRIVKAR